MGMRAHAMLVLLLLAPAAWPQGAPLDEYLQQARERLAQDRLAEARQAVEEALERDALHLGALALRAKIAEQQGDLDAAVWSLHEVIQIARARGAEDRTAAEAAAETLKTLDTTAGDWSRIRDHYLAELLQIAAEHEKKKRLHSALALFAHAREVDPFDPRPSDGVQRVRREGGADVAVADVYAGGDPTFGKSDEWIAKQDLLHVDWDKAWANETDNYRYRTNAGYRVLMTSSIAMEGVNRFYRRFFRHQEDGGKIAKIEIRIFKSRDEYLKLGRNPVEWSGGHFIGDAVETFVGGVSGNESIRQMYGTLFHEAAHHFVSLTSPRCPGWLNEAFASFFEGCEILSNGSVRWNRVPTHRLFPLAQRLEKGWMAAPDEGIAQDGTGEPERAPSFRMVVEGRYAWGPPWYAPTWGVVYFLHNYRDQDGRLVYRDALQDYYNSFKGKQPQDAAAHFQEIVLSAKRSPVRTLDELSEVWKRWIIDLRDRHQGKTAKAENLVTLAQGLLAKKDTDAALELLEEAYLADPRNPDVLWLLAGLCEQRKQTDRAAALYRELDGELDARGLAAIDPRARIAKEKADRLDPLVQRWQRLQQRTAQEGLALARSYLDRGLPTMALQVTRRMSAQFAIPEALALYEDVARRTGKTLARWRLAYNERDLRGWSDADQAAYQAYGKEIRARVAESGEAGGKSFTTCVLTCDEIFAGDFSLETEIWIEPDKAKVAGLCFARKDATNYLAALLHPKGFLDVAANRGGTWEVLDHRQVPLAKGWHKLRIDVAGKSLDLYLDGQWLRTLPFASEDALFGGFGLVTGAGETSYRMVRVLARDPRDPSARLERELAMRRIAEDASLRAADTFTGFAPPELVDARWMRGGPVDPRQPGKATVLLFWSRTQEQQMPTLAYAKHLAAELAPAGVRVVLLAGDRATPSLVAPVLGETGALVAATDPSGRIFEAYGIRRGGFGLPRAVLVDIDGKVVFEGDLGLTRGEGWKPGTVTYLDDPVQKLVKERRLADIAKLAPSLPAAIAKLHAGDLAGAITLLRPLAALPVDPHPDVREARRRLDEARTGESAWLLLAPEAMTDRPLATAARIATIAQAFAGEELGKQAAALAKKVTATSDFQRATGARKLLEQAREVVRKGGNVAEARSAAEVEALLGGG
jgi:hypothetical protein